MSDGTSKELARLCEFDRTRDGSQKLRVSLDEFTSADGNVSTYVSARIWTRGSDGDKWFPTAKGVTIRQREIHDFAMGLKEALVKMSSATQPAPKSAPRTQAPQAPRQQVQRSFADDGEDLSCGGVL